jgi:hypothetical protein
MSDLDLTRFWKIQMLIEECDSNQGRLDLQEVMVKFFFQRGLCEDQIEGNSFDCDVLQALGAEDIRIELLLIQEKYKDE